MRSKDARRPVSAILLALSGILLIGVGCYFLFARPALLPEDIRYMQLTPAELQSVGSRLAAWLTHVFRVMGGYVTASGVLAFTLAVTAFANATLGRSPTLPMPAQPRSAGWPPSTS